MSNAPAETTARTLVPWAVVTAAVAAVVCLAGWPRPTLYALGAVAGAIALLVGLRLLATERGQTSRPPCAGCAGCGGPDCIERPEDADLTAQEARDLADDLGRQLYRAEDALAYVAECCDIADRETEPVTTARVREWLKGAQCARVSGLVLDPDGSGHDPETARTNPDTPEVQPVDQDGHDPDGLRTRIADAIRTALKERTIPPLTLYGHQASPGIGLSEYDLADVVLAVVQPEFDRLADQPSACDASEVIDIGFFGRPHAFGPCTLRQGHAGPVHKAANGAQWWPTNQPDIALTPPADQPEGDTA